VLTYQGPFHAATGGLEELPAGTSAGFYPHCSPGSTDSPKLSFQSLPRFGRAGLISLRFTTQLKTAGILPYQTTTRLRTPSTLPGLQPFPRAAIPPPSSSHCGSPAPAPAPPWSGTAAPPAERTRRRARPARPGPALALALVASGLPKPRREEKPPGDSPGRLPAPRTAAGLPAGG